MRSKQMLVATFALALFAAVAGAESADPYAALAGTNWRVTEIAGQSFESPKRPTLTFGPDRRIGGAGACNHYGARYTPDASDPQRRLVTIRVESWTKMLCRGRPGEIDSMLGEALTRTKRFETTQGGLIAYDGAGAVTLRFVPADAPKR